MLFVWVSELDLLYPPKFRDRFCLKLVAALTLGGNNFSTKKRFFLK
jgi:hypothetical protein